MHDAALGQTPSAQTYKEEDIFELFDAATPALPADANSQSSGPAIDSFGDFELFDAAPLPCPLAVPTVEIAGVLPGEDMAAGVNATQLEQSGAGVPPAIARQDGRRDGRPTSGNSPALAQSPPDVKKQDELGDNVELF